MPEHDTGEPLKTHFREFTRVQPRLAAPRASALTALAADLAHFGTRQTHLPCQNAATAHLRRLTQRLRLYTASFVVS